MEQIIDFAQEWLFNLMMLILPIIGSFIVFWLKAQVDILKQRLEENKPKLAYAIAEASRLAVRAAEGMELAGYIEDKKQYAMDIAQQWLDKKGWDEVEFEILEAAIEAEVLSALNSDKAGVREGYSVGSW